MFASYWAAKVVRSVYKLSSDLYVSHLPLRLKDLLLELNEVSDWKYCCGNPKVEHMLRALKTSRARASFSSGGGGLRPGGTPLPTGMQNPPLPQTKCGGRDPYISPCPLPPPPFQHCPCTLAHPTPPCPALFCSASLCLAFLRFALLCLALSCFGWFCLALPIT